MTRRLPQARAWAAPVGSRNRSDGGAHEARIPLMAIRIIQLGTPRQRDEGLRIGTVRRPPRGVKKADYAAQNWYDVWLPEVAPSAALVREALASASDAEWRRFVTRYEAELRQPEASRLLDLLTALSHRTALSVGCYCDDETRCHRSILRRVLEERGALVT